MPRNTRKTATTSASSPENPIAASVHGATTPPGPGLLFSLKRFLRRVFITLFLLGFVVVPLVVYFTDVAPPAREELRKLVSEYSLYRKTRQELNLANQRIAELEDELKTAVLESPTESETKASEPEAPRAEATESPVRKKKSEKVTTLKNGVTVRSYIDISHGERASRVRNRKEAYELETRLKINQPRANQTVDELGSLNPELPDMLPGLSDLLADGKVSPLFEKIYELKLERVVKHLSAPAEMETRHNFFDCETILALTHPKTKKKVLLMQGEMDVVADGTDGDRWPYLNEKIASSRYFQHATSYRWKKKTRTPNPLLDRAEDELKKVLARYSVKGLSKSENASLRSRRDELRRQIREMESTSFLIAEVDPFIVLPLSFLKQSQLTHAPSIGDFAVVIHQDKLYPAICGDAGPSWKLGEGSLFMARAINPKSSPYYRPVSDLKVTYLVFPGTRPEKSDSPDLIDWRNRCRDLLEGIGGLGEAYQLHNWRDLPAERRSLNELEKLASEFPPLIEKRDESVDAAKKALAAAEEKVAGLRKKIVKLEDEERLREKELKKQSETANDDSESTADSTSEPAEDAKLAKEKEAEAQKVREEWLEAEKQKIVLENKLKEAGQSAATARELSKRTMAAIEKAKDIAKLPESTPREQSTDIILAALDESREAIEILEGESAP